LTFLQSDSGWVKLNLALYSSPERTRNSNQGKKKANPEATSVGKKQGPTNRVDRKAKRSETVSHGLEGKVPERRKGRGTLQQKQERGSRLTSRGKSSREVKVASLFG